MKYELLANHIISKPYSAEGNEGIVEAFFIRPAAFVREQQGR